MSKNYCTTIEQLLVASQSTSYNTRLLPTKLPKIKSSTCHLPFPLFVSLIITDQLLNSNPFKIKAAN